MIITGTAEDKKHQVNTPSCVFLKLPGGETNTGITVCLPAGFMSVALYVPVLAEVTAMVRVKLKVVPAGEEQGLLRV